MRRLFSLFGLVLLLSPLGLSGQETEDANKIYQLSGMVINARTSEPIPYARIMVNRTHGVLSNDDGFYSVPVTQKDTLRFNHVGYHPEILVVRDYLEDYQNRGSQYIYIVNYLREDTVTLPTVNIFPYDTPEELRTAMINMDLDENSPEAIASRNLDPRVMHSIIETLPIDSDERLLVGRRMYQDYYRDRNLFRNIGFDAVAATQLLKYVVDRSKKSKNKDLNYWEE